MTAADAARDRLKIGVQEKYISGLAHIFFHVRDVDEATAFWIDLFEATPTATVRAANCSMSRFPAWCWLSSNCPAPSIPPFPIRTTPSPSRRKASGR